MGKGFGSSALLAVAGACSRSGKTAAAASLLRALPGAMAVKFTVTEDVFERCPRGSRCVVCDIDVPFRIVDDPAVLDEPGTDTARFREAGARRVLWAITRASAAPLAWAVVRARIDAPVVVIEGSTVVSLAHPDRVVFVAHPFLSTSRWKAGSAALAARADLVVVNRPAGERRPPDAEVARALGVPFALADVTSPAERWAAALLAGLQPAAVAAIGDPG